jgi:lysophospholipase L1-like esterase
VIALALVAVLAMSRDAVVVGNSNGTPFTYVVLGDSTAAGVGADYDQGIAMTTARELGRERRVTMLNYAVSGARTKDVLEEQLPGAERIRADAVLLSVGANDVTHLTSVRSMRKSLQEIVRRLRAANPDVAIVITGSPDMGSPPRVPRLLRGIASWRTKRVNEMFIEEANGLGLTFAPIAAETGPLFRRDRSLFHPDRFHPNERGYATWAPVLNGALATATRSGRPLANSPARP